MQCVSDFRRQAIEQQMLMNHAYINTFCTFVYTDMSWRMFRKMFTVVRFHIDFLIWNWNFLCMDVHVLVWCYVCVGVRTCRCQKRTLRGRVCSVTVHFFLLRQDLSLFLELVVKRLQPSSCFQIFHGCWGLELRSSFLLASFLPLSAAPELSLLGACIINPIDEEKVSHARHHSHSTDNHDWLFLYISLHGSILDPP